MQFNKFKKEGKRKSILAITHLKVIKCLIDEDDDPGITKTKLPLSSSPPVVGLDLRRLGLGVPRRSVELGHRPLRRAHPERAHHTAQHRPHVRQRFQLTKNGAQFGWQIVSTI